MSTRPATGEERRHLARCLRVEAVGLVSSAVIVVGMVGCAGAGIGFVIEWSLGFADIEVTPHVHRALAALFGLGGLAHGLNVITPDVRTALRGHRLLAREPVVEVLHVEDPTLVMEDPEDAKDLGPFEPVLHFGIDDDHVLTLGGHVLVDPETYLGPGAVRPSEPADTLNGLASPHAFPSTEFRVVRFAPIARIIGIEPLGDYLEPHRRIPVDTPPEAPPSEFISERSIDSITVRIS